MVLWSELGYPTVGVSDRNGGRTHAGGEAVRLPAPRSVPGTGRITGGNRSDPLHPSDLAFPHGCSDVECDVSEGIDQIVHPLAPK
jgi:hypothetical protein